MLDTLQFGIVALIVLAGSTVLSTVGFGIAIATSPLLLLFLEPQTVVVMLNTVSPVVYFLVMVQTRAHLRVREMAPVSVAGLLGVPIGVYVLSVASPSVLRIAISVLVLVLTLALLGLRNPISMPAPYVLGPLAGFSVGAVLSAVGIGGPILALFLLARNWGTQAIRASLSFYFLLIEAAAVVGYALAGMFTAELIALILVVMAPAVLGFGAGSVLVRRLNEARFRQGVVAVVLVSSVMVLARELYSL